MNRANKVPRPYTGTLRVPRKENEMSDTRLREFWDDDMMVWKPLDKGNPVPHYWAFTNGRYLNHDCTKELYHDIVTGDTYDEMIENTVKYLKAKAKS